MEHWACKYCMLGVLSRTQAAAASGMVLPCDWRAGRVQECDRLGDFQGVRDFLEYKSPGSSRTGALAMALINSEQELAREHTRWTYTCIDGPRDMMHITAGTYLQIWSQAPPGHLCLSCFSE